jgi:8-oxo-dGTP pyrophosphatase MutT (NUDIX family)
LPGKINLYLFNSLLFKKGQHFFETFRIKSGKSYLNMKFIKEVQEGDTRIRAGIVITDGQYLLVEQPTNMIQNGWRLDLPKGHLLRGETPLQGAIREVFEETNIKFEPWKLTRPIQVICDGDPLFLFYAKIDQIIPVSILSCASTFIDKDGIQKPEVEAYYWLNPRTQLHLVQERLIPGIRYYFKNQTYLESTDEFIEMEKEFEDCCQTTGEIMGSIPPKNNRILSLGYKNGKALSPLKTDPPF